MQTHPKKPGFIPSRYHQPGSKGYPQQYPTHQFHQTPTGGDVGGYGGGPTGAAGVQVRLAQFAPQQQGPQIRPSAPTNPHQAPHTPHNNGPPPQHSQHTHPSVTLSQHSQHHPVLQTAGAAGVGSHVPGPSPAPPGAHEMSTQGIPPPGTSQQLQQGSGSLPVSAHSMIYGSTSQSQPQGPQANAQGQFYPHHGAGNASHLHNPAQQRHVVGPSQAMTSFPVMPPSMMQYFQSAHGTGHNIVYQIPFQPMAPPRQTTPQNQYPPQLPAHPPQGHYPPMFQPQGVFYPPSNTAQQPIKAPPNATPQQRESRRIAIIDPHTGKNILDDVSKENNVKPDKTPTPPSQSSEASASNTPAPSGAPQKEDIAAQFAADVARRAADTETVESDKVDGLERTNKPYEPNSMVIISSDQIKDKNNSSIANKQDSELEESVDSLESKSVSVSAVDNSQAKQAEIIQMPLKPIQQQIQQRQQSPEAILLSKKQQQVQQQPPSSQQPQPQQQQQPPLSQQPLPQAAVLLHQQAQQQQQQQQQQQPQQQQQQQQQQVPPQQPQQQQQQLPQPEMPVQQQKQPPQEKSQSKISPPILQSVPQPTSQTVTQVFSQSSVQPPVQPITQAAPQVVGQPVVSPSSRPGNKVAQVASSAATQQPGSHGQQGSVMPDNPPQHQSKSEPESQQPPKQPSPKPEVVQPSRSKEKEHTPEPHLESKRRQVGGVANREDPSSSSSTITTSTTSAAASSGPARETAARQPSPSPSPQPQTQPPQPQPPQPQVAHAQSQVAHPQQPPAPSLAAVPAPTPAAAPPAAVAPAGSPAPPVAAPTPPQAQREPPTHHPSTSKSPERSPSSGVKTPPVQQNSRGATPSSLPTSQPVSKETTPQPEVPKEEVASERNSVDRQSNAENEYNNVEHGGDPEGDAEETSEKTSVSAQLKYSYKEDQWSPANQDGKRQYDRNFLLELQNNPLSLRKPESLPNLEVVKNGPPRSKPFDPVTLSKNMPRGPDFMPNYVRSASGNKGQKTHCSSRSSTGSRRKVINIQLSSGSEVKLRKSEDAWKPTHKDALGADNEEELKTQECLKKMRGILNKLTPEKFGKLVESVRTLPINTTERLSGVIDLIFEKAVDEQAFSSTYAQMCQVLCHMSVKENENESGKGELKFRNVIITKCQKEFEKDNMDELKKEDRVKEIEQCVDPEKKLELHAKLEYDEIKLRKRSVGNIRFIGELYKLKMLTSPIMMRIIGTLLDKGDEESLECLCKLLTTIGKQLETSCSQKVTAMEELEKQFRKMEKIINGRGTSSRVRFLMLDVVELRQQGWKPRREENNPKTKAAVHEEVKREEIEQQVALSQTPARRDDNKDRKRSRDNNRGNAEEGWSTVHQKSRNMFDSARMKTFSRPGAADSKDVQLRGSGFSSWGRGSSGGMKDQNDEQKPTSNRYTVLEEAGDNRWGAPMGGARLAPGGGSGPRQGSSYGSKSMPPPSNDKHDAISMVKKFVGSTDQSRSRDSSMTREPANDGFKGASSLTEDQANKLSIAIIEEFTSNVDVKEATLCIREKFSSKTVKLFIKHSFEWVLDRDKSKRVLVGQLYHDLIINNLLLVDSLVEGCKEIICMTEDFVIDIPQVCLYIGEILAPCLIDNAVTLNHIHDLALSAGNKGAEVLALTVAQAATLMAPKKVVELWNTSGLDWCVIVPDNTDAFLKKHKVEFTVSKNVPNVANNVDGLQPQQQTQLQKIQAELIKLFKRAQNDEIFNWIDANIGNNVKMNKFIRALVTALVESQFTTSEDGSSVVMDDTFEERLKCKCNVILRYVDGNETLELQCVYALQALSVKHQHPPGLLEKCFNTFYDSDVITEEAFESWVKSNDPEEQDGKGVCVNSVRTFLCWLREAEPADEGEPVA